MGFKARRPRHCCSACHHAFHDKHACKHRVPGIVSGTVPCGCEGFINDKGEAVSYTVPAKPKP